MEKSSHAFETTQWTQVLCANGKSREAKAALRELCDRYYRPVEVFIERCIKDQKFNSFGSSVVDYRDLTQSFFTTLLSGNGLENVEPARGKFRSYLLGAVKNFLSTTFASERASKRGGLITHQTIYSQGTDDDSSSDEVVDSEAFPSDAFFDREWAVKLLEIAIEQVRAEFLQGAGIQGNELRFEVLQRWLVQPIDESASQEAMMKLQMNEGAFRVAVHRLRKRFRKVVTSLIASTVDDPGDVARELDYLIEVLSIQS